MKNLSKVLLVATLSGLMTLSVWAQEMELDLNEAANNVDVEGIKVNDYESGDVEIWGTKVNASEGTMEDGNYKADAEAGKAEIDGETYQGEGTEMDGVEKLWKVKTGGDTATDSKDGEVENNVELNAAGAENMEAARLPTTGAEEVVILILALTLAGGMMYYKSRRA